MTTGVHEVQSDAGREDAYDVRWHVFVEEQGVDPDLEIDDHEDEAVHFVAYDQGTAVGAARLREPEAGIGKVERVAVLKSHRGDGWGRRLMDAVESLARDRGLETLELNSQTRAAGFYESLGYEQVGDEFMEADIPHVKMVKSLR